MVDDEQPPRDPLVLIQQEQAAMVRRIVPDPRLLLWPWGIAWLLGFTVFFLRYGPDDRVLVAMPPWLPLVFLLALIATAGTITGIVGARAARQVTGPSSRQGGMYGLTWALAFAGMISVLNRIGDQLPTGLANLVYAGTMTALTGALHMAGGALWDDRTLFRLGAFISVINVVGVILGAGWHALVVGLVSWLRMPR
ncbi:transporter [Actinoplanes sp. NPDC049548]|uniref:transporter n=1 Tax=Actinoplanes sp. NPDC049548 TaxID=3155152 RepID=UPI003422AEAB